MIVFDTSIFVLSIDRNSAVPLDPRTSQPLLDAPERVGELIKRLSQQKSLIILPTPVISEFLRRGGPDGLAKIELLQKSRNFLFAPFDLKSAIQCSSLVDGDPVNKKLNPQETKAKQNFDRQIISIALTNNAHTIYTGDNRLAEVAKKNGLNAILTWELPLPKKQPQMQIWESYPASDEIGTF